MPYNPLIHHRQSIRLAGYDYSQAGAYHITLCVANRQTCLGEVKEGQMLLSALGLIVKNEWLALPDYHPIDLDMFVIMPDHLHGIIILLPPTPKRPATSLGKVLRQFKIFSSKVLNKARQGTGAFWQRNYYEHIVRDEADLQRIRTYITENPLRWKEETRGEGG
jgi:REP element-mobilizing transposase RayT